MKSVVPALLCVLLVTGGCVSNPALHPKANEQELVVGEDTLMRGSEKLDEQDFYELAGDRDSAKKIAARRAGGERRQKLSVALFTVGFGLLAGATLMYYKIPEAQFGDVPRWAAYVTAGVGFFTVLGGADQLRTGGERAGPKWMFDSKHAQGALEVGRYGASGLTANAVKTLEIITKTGKPSFCSVSGAAITDVTAKDDKGLAIKLDGHADWLSWSSTPADLLLPADEKTPRARTVQSPLTRSLATLDSPVKVTVAVDGGATQSVDLAPDFGCAETLSFVGKTGTYGKPGDKGDTVQDGGPGDDGTDGSVGPTVDVEAAFVLVNGKRLLLVAASSDDGTKYAIVDPASGSLTVDASGGVGGEGGHGGQGGRATLGNECTRQKTGDGGPGGRGGVGGRGGQVTVRGPREALDKLTVNIQGGAGGEGGYGGSGGDLSHFKSCEGPQGAKGREGRKGKEGEPGAVKKSAATADSLGKLAEILRSNPAVELEAGAKKKR